MAATVLAGASPFHPAVLSVPEGHLVLLADDPTPVGLLPDDRLAAVAAAHRHEECGWNDGVSGRLGRKKTLSNENRKDPT